MAAARAFKAADVINVSTSQVVPHQNPICCRMYRTRFSDTMRNKVGTATMAVGNTTTTDQMNTIVVTGRAVLVALARPHPSEPYFTLDAAAWYQRHDQFCAKLLNLGASAGVIPRVTAIMPCEAGRGKTWIEGEVNTARVIAAEFALEDAGSPVTAGNSACPVR